MLFKRCLGIFLALLILFAESGQTIYAHTCYKTHQISLSIYAPSDCNMEKTPKSCCHKPEKHPNKTCQFQKTPCCGVTTILVKQNLESNQIELKKMPVHHQAFVHLPLVTLFTQQPELISFPLPYIFNPQPPALAQLQVFRC